MTYRDLPKARYVSGDGALVKARAMLRCGKSEQYVSDYLGMIPEQVRGIANNLSTGIPGRPRQDAIEPIALTPEDVSRRANAMNGSDALLRAIQRLGA